MTDTPATAASIAASYDAIAYDALPHPVSHPDNVGAVAFLMGLPAPALAGARVLEVGCNNGANLLPMAAALPAATFVGCDLAPTAVDAATRGAQALGLGNVRVLRADLADFDEGPWDYVIAHGFYSWVPAPVREALLAFLGRRLAPDGLAFVSYNTLPGGYVRRAAWEGLRWHTRHAATREEKLREARALAALLAEAGPTHDKADASVRAEYARIAAERDSALFHDTLSEPNEPVWFRDFVGAAERHGLAYVAEAMPQMMAGAGLSLPMRQFLASRDRLEREQYLDIARVRRFRHSILCRGDAAGRIAIAPDRGRLDGLKLSAAMPLLRSSAEGRMPATSGPDAEAFRALLEALVATAPAAAPVPEVLARVPGPGEQARKVVLRAWISGLAQVHLEGPRLASTVPARPQAFACARWQAGAGELVTSLRHEPVRVADPLARALLPLCDGTRDRTALAAALRDRFDLDEARLLGRVDDALASFAQSSLLTAP